MRGYFDINAAVINELWENNACTRHYITYLELECYGLLNTWFEPGAVGLSERYIYELSRKAKSLVRTKDGSYVQICNITQGNIYHLPERFMKEGHYELLSETLKHYLKLLVHAYSANRGYAFIRISQKTMRKKLEYSGVPGVYYLIKRLAERGFGEFKGSTLKLYYKPTFGGCDVERPGDSSFSTTENCGPEHT